MADKKEQTSITIPFRGEDAALLEKLIADAKTQRRSVSQYVLMYLVDNYESPKVS